MIELMAMNAVKGKDDNKDPDKYKKSNAVATSTVVVIWVAFWIWAVSRALKCSSNTPDSRVLHLMFATASPGLYLLFSYNVSGFCR
jgi:hypothetical protein